MLGFEMLGFENAGLLGLFMSEKSLSGYSISIIYRHERVENNNRHMNENAG